MFMITDRMFEKPSEYEYVCLVDTSDNDKQRLNLQQEKRVAIVDSMTEHILTPKHRVIFY